MYCAIVMPIHNRYRGSCLSRLLTLSMLCSSPHAYSNKPPPPANASNYDTILSGDSSHTRADRQVCSYCVFSADTVLSISRRTLSRRLLLKSTNRPPTHRISLLQRSSVQAAGTSPINQVIYMKRPAHIPLQPRWPFMQIASPFR